MSISPRCHLTAKDYAFLQELLEYARRHQDEAYLRLLRSKLATAIVMFPDDIDPWVAAIGSRIEFTANAGLLQTRILVDGEPDDERRDPGTRGLPVTTHWGLALLGLVAGQTIRIDEPGGTVQLRLEKVTSLPRRPTAARAAEKRAVGAGASESGAGGATVLDFVRPAAGARKAPPPSPIDPDDDPGPTAA